MRRQHLLEKEENLPRLKLHSIIPWKGKKTQKPPKGGSSTYKKNPLDPLSYSTGNQTKGCQKKKPGGKRAQNPKGAPGWETPSPKGPRFNTQQRT